MNPAIVIVGYNRKDSLLRLFKSVLDAYYPCENIPMIVSLDYSDLQSEIASEIEKIGWKHGELIIRCAEKRMGLKRHVISCGDLSIKYGSVIVLEDDLIVSPNYYSYVLQMIKSYEDNDNVCGVSLYSHAWNGYGNYQFIPQRNEYDVFMGQIGVSWGQCWTKKQWLSFKCWYEDNKNTEKFANDKLPWIIDEWGNQSWAKYFYNYMVVNDKYYVIPYTALSTNYAEIGEHNSETTTTYQVMLMDAREKTYITPTFEEAIKYDMFFERIFDAKSLISGIRGDLICVNLYGYKQSVGDYKYLLTGKKYPDVKPIKTYGLRLRPIEANVINDVSGNDIYLYDADEFREIDISSFRRTAQNRIQYEIYGNPKRRLETYCRNIDYYSLVRKIDIDEKTWGVQGDSALIQQVLEEKINERNSNGFVWMFHNITKSKKDFDEEEYSITIDKFEWLIRESQKKGYKFIPTDQVINNSDEKNIYITFDDGYEGVYELAYPVLKKYKIPFTIFVTNNYLNEVGYLNTNQLRIMVKDELCSVGGHTLNHSLLRVMNERMIRREITQGKELLENELGIKINKFAYPFGSIFAVDDRCIEIVKESGYNMAFSTVEAHVIQDERIRYFIPRFNINENNADDTIRKL